MTKPSDEALMRAADMLRGMQRSHEVEVAVATFLQEVSDAAKAASEKVGHLQGSSLKHDALEALAPFILPEPVDPLVAVMETWARTPGSASHCPAAERARVMREALAKRGLKIVGADA